MQLFRSCFYCCSNRKLQDASRLAQHYYFYKRTAEILLYNKINNLFKDSSVVWSDRETELKNN